MLCTRVKRSCLGNELSERRSLLETALHWSDVLQLHPIRLNMLNSSESTRQWPTNTNCWPTLTRLLVFVGVCCRMLAFVGAVCKLLKTQNHTLDKAQTQKIWPPGRPTGNAREHGKHTREDLGQDRGRDTSSNQSQQSGPGSVNATTRPGDFRLWCTVAGEQVSSLET